MKVLPLIAILLLTTGCATPVALHEDKTYPASWPKFVPAGVGIEGIDGSYENDAEVTEGTELHIRLVDLFPEILRVEPKDAKVVTLRVVLGERPRHGPTPAKLQISLLGDVVYHYECDCFVSAGNLSLTRAQGFGALGPVLMMASESRVTMERTADGSLVVKLDDVAAGEILLIPYGSHSTAWLRFRRVVDPTPATAERPDKADHH